MKLMECMIAWDPPAQGEPLGQRVEVGPWPDESGWSDAYVSTTGACYVDRHKAEPWQQVAMLFIDFHGLVVGDRMDPQVVHQAFLAIDEYRARIAPDIPGAD